jgi:hypothetical protein
LRSPGFAPFPSPFHLLPSLPMLPETSTRNSVLVSESAFGEPNRLLMAPLTFLKHVKHISGPLCVVSLHPQCSSSIDLKGSLRSLLKCYSTCGLPWQDLCPHPFSHHLPSYCHPCSFVVVCLPL